MEMVLGHFLRPFLMVIGSERVQVRLLRDLNWRSLLARFGERSRFMTESTWKRRLAF